MRPSRVVNVLLFALAACGDFHPAAPAAAPAAGLSNTAQLTIALTEKAGPSEQGKSWLGPHEHLTTGHRLYSPSNLFFLEAMPNGELRIFKGQPGAQNWGQVWRSHDGGTASETFYTYQNPLGSLSSYRWRDRKAPLENPSDKVWRSREAMPVKNFMPVPHYTVLQDDGNLCTYPGNSPAENRGQSIWCSQSNTPVVWSPKGKILRMKPFMHDGAFPLFYGFVQQKKIWYTYVSPSKDRSVEYHLPWWQGERSSKVFGFVANMDAGSYWVLENTSIKFAGDTRVCLGYKEDSESPRVEVVQCATGPHTTGWRYDAAASRIWNGNRCMALWTHEGDNEVKAVIGVLMMRDCTAPWFSYGFTF